MQPHGHRKNHCYEKRVCCPCQQPGRKTDVWYQISSLIQYLLGFMAFWLLLTSPKNIQLYITKTPSGPHQLCYQVKKLRRNRTAQCANTMSESESQGICLCANMCCFEICVGRYRITPALHLNMTDINLKVDPMNIVYVDWRHSSEELWNNSGTCITNENTLTAISWYFSER